MVSVAKTFLESTKRLVWVSTTPVPDVDVSPSRKPEDVIAYNKAAYNALDAAIGFGAKGEGRLQFIDLWQAVIERCGGSPNYTACDIQRPKNVHYLEPGRQYTGITMAQGIIQAIGTVNATVPSH